MSQRWPSIKAENFFEERRLEQIIKLRSHFLLRKGIKIDIRKKNFIIDLVVKNDKNVNYVDKRSLKNKQIASWNIWMGILNYKWSGYVQYVQGIQPNVPARTTCIYI